MISGHFKKLDGKREAFPVRVLSVASVKAILSLDACFGIRARDCGRPSVPGFLVYRLVFFSIVRYVLLVCGHLKDFAADRHRLIASLKYVNVSPPHLMLFRLRVTWFTENTDQFSLSNCGIESV